MVFKRKKSVPSGLWWKEKTNDDETGLCDEQCCAAFQFVYIFRCSLWCKCMIFEKNPQPPVLFGVNTRGVTLSVNFIKRSVLLYLFTPKDVKNCLYVYVLIVIMVLFLVPFTCLIVL